MNSYNPGCENSIDEAMIPFKGRSSEKAYKKGFQTLGQGWCPPNFYCDNFFTSVPLFEDLLKEGIYACGTLNPQRKHFPLDLKPFVNRGLQNRGDIEYRQRGSLLFTMWQDTKLVFMLSINAQANAEQNVHVGRRMEQAWTYPVQSLYASTIVSWEVLTEEINCKGIIKSGWLKSRKCQIHFLVSLWCCSSERIHRSLQVFPCRKKNKNTEGLRMQLAKELIGSYNSRKYTVRPIYRYNLHLNPTFESPPLPY